MKTDVCGKVSYENQGLALVSGDEFNKHRIKEGDYELIFTSYKCTVCLDWHLTSLN